MSILVGALDLFISEKGKRSAASKRAASIGIVMSFRFMVAAASLCRDGLAG